MATEFCGRGQRVHFAFDLNRELHGYGREYFKFLKNLPGLSWGPKLGQPSWPTSLDAVQLQAADLLAYLLILFMPTRLGNPKAKPDWMLRLATGRQWPDTMKFLDKVGLDLLLSNCSREEIKAFEVPQQPKRTKAYHIEGLA